LKKHGFEGIIHKTKPFLERGRCRRTIRKNTKNLNWSKLPWIPRLPSWANAKTQDLLAPMDSVVEQWPYAESRGRNIELRD
jgi:hypothetical protein